jgi:hypothetical protein
MLSRLLSWIGWDLERPQSPPMRPPVRPRSATSHLFVKTPPGGEVHPPKQTGDNDFNPYNTGKFDRSASWERISKNQR